jgi:membrane-associated phospholipid phosphatase
MAAQDHIIQPIVRISSDVWWTLGLHDFPSFYNHISANAVAAVPSLHAAWATLFFIFVLKIYGWRWSLAAAVYPLLIYVGTVYQGEHYAFDEIIGAAYAAAAYWLTPYVMRWLKRLEPRVKSAYSSSTKNVSRSAR